MHKSSGVGFTSRPACSGFPFVQRIGHSWPVVYVCPLADTCLTWILQTQKIVRLGVAFIVPLTVCPLSCTQRGFRDEKGGKSPDGGVHAHVGSASRVWTGAGGWCQWTSWVQFTSRVVALFVSSSTPLNFVCLKVSLTLALSIHVTLGTHTHRGTEEHNSVRA